MAASLGLAVTAWGVLEAGTLTGKAPEDRRWPDDPVSATSQRVIAALRAVAEAHEASPAQVAIAWLLQRPAPPTLVPIIAARRPEQIVENVAARELSLSDAEFAQLEEAGRPELGFPRSFLESQDVRELIYGTTYERIVA